ncbi:MAG: GntG family PLP-dependent aldolase, partial [Acidobacteriota bacterium]
EVGDDVFAEDPTVNRLQERAAELFGKEAALFVPTGTMGNQIAVNILTRPGQEIVIEERGHILNFELGGAAVNSGVTIRAVKSMDGAGHLTWGEIEPVLKINGPYYQSSTGLICLENTHNFAGGSVMTAAACKEICEKAHNAGLPVHMDGARIFNAAAALNTPVAALVEECDSVMFTLSKALGAPAGSILLGSADLIRKARICRKRMGGGMRQIGILAAACIVALEESPKILVRDHQNARRLADGLAGINSVEIDADRVATNIVIFDVSGAGRDAASVCAELKTRGILAIGFGYSIRMVTHFGITEADIDTTLKALSDIL